MTARVRRRVTSWIAAVMLCLASGPVWAAEAFPVTHSPGIAARIWQSAVAVHNLDSGDISCSLKLLSGPSLPITVTEAEGVWSAEDVVPLLTGSTASVTDGMTVDCSGTFAVTSRLWGESLGNDAGGFDIATTEGLNQLTPLLPLAVLGAANSVSRRTDVWLINLNPTATATVQVTARPGGAARLLSVPPHAMTTTRGLLASMGLAGASNVTLELDLFGSSTGPVAVTVGLLDRDAGDFAALTAQRRTGPAFKSAVPVERTADDALITHLDLYNPGASAAVAWVSASLTDGTLATTSVVVPPMTPVTLPDVLQDTFGLLQGSGLLWVDAGTDRVLVQARSEHIFPWGVLAGGTASLPFTTASVLRGSGWARDAGLSVLAGSPVSGSDVGLNFSPPTSPRPSPPSTRIGSVLGFHEVASASASAPIGNTASVTEIVVDALPEAVAFAHHERPGYPDPSWTPLWRSIAPRPVITGNARMCRNVPADLVAFPQWTGSTLDWFLNGRPYRPARGFEITTRRRGTYHVASTFPGFNVGGRSRPVDVYRSCLP